MAKGKLRKILCKITGFLSVEGSWFLFKGLCGGKVEGLSNLPECPYIIAANHVSYLDWLILYGLFMKKTGQKVVFLAKKRLFNSSYFSLLMEYGNTICVDLGKFDKELFQRANEVAAQNGILGIFPEGKRSENGKLEKAHEGIAMLALLTKMPVVPIGLDGIYDLLPKGSFIPRISKCAIRIGQPLKFDDAGANSFSTDNLQRITRQTMCSIGSLCSQPYEF